MKLNGWQRIGIVLSAAWLIFCLIFWVLVSVGAPASAHHPADKVIMAAWIIGPILVMWAFGYATAWIVAGFRGK